MNRNTKSGRQKKKKTRRPPSQGFTGNSKAREDGSHRVCSLGVEHTEATFGGAHGGGVDEWAQKIRGPIEDEKEAPVTVFPPRPGGGKEPGFTTFHGRRERRELKKKGPKEKREKGGIVRKEPRR